ncbi:MAG: WYL domain-containing protein [Bacteroidetes bacterium]|nr:WYL domain-containing protein [Bacteroidota bacterium]
MQINKLTMQLEFTVQINFLYLPKLPGACCNSIPDKFRYFFQMATNKHALIRYKILDKCFRNTGRRYFIADLMEAVDQVLEEIHPDSGPISRRQIFDDITFMESSEGWAVELERLKDGRKVYYRYSDPSFSINNMPLNDLEIKQLNSAIEILTQFKGMPQFDWMQELLPKLQEGILTEKNSTIIEFDSNKYLKGINWLGELFNAIIYHKVLIVKYNSFTNRKTLLLEIHPYYLKQYNSRWFLFGHNPSHNSMTNLALDRISDISEIEKKFVENQQIDFNEYFDDVVGVTVKANQQPEKIELWISKGLWPYIETKPIHGSQKSKEKK